MRALLAQHLAHRQHRFAPDLVVDRDRVEEGLDLLRRGEALERGELGPREAELLAARETPAAGRALPIRWPVAVPVAVRISVACRHPRALLAQLRTHTRRFPAGVSTSATWTV